MNHKSNKVHRLVVRRTDINIAINIGKWGELLKLFINLIRITFHKYYICCGIGGNTISNKTDEEKKAIGNKISNILSGKSKPDGFAEHLSDIRTGKGNPMAKVLNPKIVVLKSTNNNSIIRSFDYVFEINAFLDDAHAGSNIVKQLKKRPYTRSKGYVFRYIQDIDNEKLNN